MAEEPPNAPTSIEHDNETGGYGLVPTAHRAVELHDDDHSGHEAPANDYSYVLSQIMATFSYFIIIYTRSCRINTLLHI